MKKSSDKVVAVSGGFDPLHVGHVRLFRDAKEFGDRLVVILNNDNWLMIKKGFVFMPEAEREELIRALACVDDVFLTSHEPGTTDISVCDALRVVQPDVFANGGDRKLDNIPEVAVCQEIGCRTVFNVGRDGKVQSSSWLVANSVKGYPCPCGAAQADGQPVAYLDCHGK
jgi:D-beta-D-heptose 7-phosphate kinase/D-beta-D-heptose 1-phosphate adenosyltransferase